MSESQGATEKVKKKPLRITIAVSKKNFNRFKCHTHTLEKILKLEGHTIIKEKGITTVVMGDKQVALGAIDLYAKSKDNIISVQTPTEGAKS